MQQKGQFYLTVEGNDTRCDPAEREFECTKSIKIELARICS